MHEVLQEIKLFFILGIIAATETSSDYDKDSTAKNDTINSTLNCLQQSATCISKQIDVINIIIPDRRLYIGAVLLLLSMKIHYNYIQSLSHCH